VDDGDLVWEHISIPPEKAHRRKLGTIYFFLLFLLQN